MPNPPHPPASWQDLETETELDFLEATKGVAMPLRLTSPAPCTNCHGSGVRRAPAPRCASCNGSGVINRNQGAFGFSEPCTDCRGSGSIIENPCDECRGTGCHHPQSHDQRADPAGVEDGQRIRLAGQGEAGLRVPRPVTCTSPCTCARTRCSAAMAMTSPDGAGQLHRIGFGVNAFGADAGRQGGVKVPKGTADGRILRVRGRAACPSAAAVLVICWSPSGGSSPDLQGPALEALEAYAAAEKASGFNPRAGWSGNRP